MFVDIAAAEKQGVIVCGTDGSFQATPEHLELIAGPVQGIFIRFKRTYGW